MTISRLLEGNTEQPSFLGRVLVVDEAGMVSGRQMEGLLKLAERDGARILFSGNTRQIQSVEASDALRILEWESQMKSVSRTGVQRQTQAEYRDAIQTLRKAPEQGFQKLEQLGAIREVPYLERPQAVASAYREHPPAFFEPLIDSEHAAALIQVHPKPCNDTRERVSSQACASASCGDSALPS
jgi:ATP-dependent exoDNAse (exonuclease V) alpha subunit